jgi:hypothetical protein
MAVRHAMFVIIRAVYDMVQIPGQEPLVVTKDAGDEAARQWWDEHVRTAAAQVFEHTSAHWERALAEWQAGTEVEVGKERLHEGGPRVEVAHVRFPDGTQGVVDPAVVHDYIAEEFRARNPHPTVAAQFADWRDTVQIAELRTWVGWLFNGAEHRPVDMGLPPSQFGYPIREVIGCLDRLAADGWQVVHVSEDRTAHLDSRGAYPDGDGTPESAVTTVRYLLSRPELSAGRGQLGTIDVDRPPAGGPDPDLDPLARGGAAELGQEGAPPAEQLGAAAGAGVDRQDDRLDSGG